MWTELPKVIFPNTLLDGRVEISQWHTNLHCTDLPREITEVCAVQPRRRSDSSPSVPGVALCRVARPASPTPAKPSVNNRGHRGGLAGLRFGDIARCHSRRMAPSNVTESQSGLATPSRKEKRGEVTVLHVNAAVNPRPARAGSPNQANQHQPPPAGYPYTSQPRRAPLTAVAVG
jgi:hypothetical protein